VNFAVFSFFSTPAVPPCIAPFLFLLDPPLNQSNCLGAMCQYPSYSGLFPLQKLHHCRTHPTRLILTPPYSQFFPALPLVPTHYGLTPAPHVDSYLCMSCFIVLFLSLSFPELNPLSNVIFDRAFQPPVQSICQLRWERGHPPLVDMIPPLLLISNDSVSYCPCDLFSKSRFPHWRHYTP